jgi:IS5 family transposase
MTSLCPLPADCSNKPSHLLSRPQCPLSHKFKVFTSGQKRCMTPAIRRGMRRRSVVEPVIGHIKNGHRMDRNYLAGPQGEAINAVLAAAGCNFRLILNWLRLLLCLIASLILLHSSSAHRPQFA